jgi:hypothetical protein
MSDTRSAALQSRSGRVELPPAEDTSAGPSTNLLTPGFLRFVGELLFGKRWQTPLAERLGAFRGKALSPATVHQWSTGVRSIPAWVREGVAASLDDIAEDFRRRADEAISVGERMRRLEVAASTQATNSLRSHKRDSAEHPST